MMLSPEPPRGLDLMTQQVYHRTNISLQLSKNDMRSLPPIPRLERRFRANGSHQFVRTRPAATQIFNLTLLAALA